MRWLEEVESRVTDLPLSEAHQELVAVLSNELGCKLDSFHLLVSQRYVSDLILIGGRRLDFLELNLLLNLQRLNFITKLVLKVGIVDNELVMYFINWHQLFFFFVCYRARHISILI